MKVKSLEALKNNPAALVSIQTSISEMISSGLFTFLRERAIPVIHDRGININSMAVEGARSAGYNECLDDILNFRERYILSKEVFDTLSLNYGGTELAVGKGDILKEEADAIRLDKSYDPTYAINSTKQQFAEFQRKRAEHTARTNATIHSK